MKTKYKSKRKIKYCNCVIYARRKARKYGIKVPYGLFTLKQKKKIINTKNPKKGRVAVMSVGSSGHLGMVYREKGNNVYIVEANYFYCRKSKRKGTEKEFRIIGYRK